MTPSDEPIEIASSAPAAPADAGEGKAPVAARERRPVQGSDDRHAPAARLAESDGAALAEVVLSLVEELRRETAEVGRLRAARETAERRAVEAEGAACRAEQTRATEAALADAFADLLESRLREARRRLRAFDRWLSDRPPRRW